VKRPQPLIAPGGDSKPLIYSDLRRWKSVVVKVKDIF
jgi:hypothetical protein